MPEHGGETYANQKMRGKTTTLGDKSTDFIRNVGLFSQVQEAPTAKTITATLTTAEILLGMITANQGSSGAATYTTPTGALLDAALPDDFGINDSIDFIIVNISVDAAEDVTLAGGSDVTIVGNAVVASNAAATDQSTGTFRIRKTASATYSVYRIA